MIAEIKADSEERMKKSAAALEDEFNRLRTGRASAALVDKIQVSYYGAATPLNQVASISVPEARLIVIQPWDKNVLPEIEKAIQKSELNLNPNNDGKVIRINIPALTEERRKELVKGAKASAENARVAVRNIRRDAIDKLKKEQKNGELTEDELKAAETDMQTLTDKYIGEVNKILDAKEKEIMESEMADEKQPDQMCRHIAVIMDGNGRWAKQRGKIRSFGHKEGLKATKRLLHYASERGLKYLTLYAFSTENWKRAEEEVSYLMNLIHIHLRKEMKFYKKNHIRLRFIGDLSRLKPSLQEEMRSVERDTASYDGLTVQLAINYGGRDELRRAVQKLIDSGKQEITEADIEAELDTAGIPDPDLIIRTAGEQRLSNFLMWQSAYSEFWYTPKLWPDFGPEDFDEAVAAFFRRDRRYGGIK